MESGTPLELHLVFLRGKHSASSLDVEELSKSVWNTEVAEAQRLRDLAEIWRIDHQRWLEEVSLLLLKGDLSVEFRFCVVYDLAQDLQDPRRRKDATEAIKARIISACKSFSDQRAIEGHICDIRACLGDTSLEEMLGLLRSQRAVRVASRLGTPRCIEFLIQMLTSSGDKYVRCDAAIGLAMAGRDDGLTVLRESLLTEHHLDIAFRSAVALASRNDPLGSGFLLATLMRDLSPKPGDCAIERDFYAYPAFANFSSVNWKQQLINQLRRELREQTALDPQ